MLTIIQVPYLSVSLLILSGAQFLSQSDISLQYFEVVDTNNDLMVSTTEVKLFASSIGNALSDQVINLLVTACNGNASGFTFPQWNCAILTLQQYGYQGEFGNDNWLIL